MKRFLSLALAGVLALSALSACTPKTSSIDANIRTTSSDAYASAEWLSERLDAIPDRVVMGTEGGSYGVEVAELEDDGYIIRTIGDEVALFARTADGLDRAVRKYAKAVEKGDRIADETYHEGYRIKKLTIAGNDISEYTVTVQGDWEYLNNWVMTNIADTFVKLVAQACGAELEIDGSAPHRIIFREATDRDDFGEANYAYRVENGDVIIEYRYEIGARNGMAMFLQNEWGWEDLIHGDSFLQSADLIEIPEGLSVDGRVAFPGGCRPDGTRAPEYDNDMVAYNRLMRPQHFWSRYRHANHGIESKEWGGVVYAHWRQICYTDDAIRENIVSDLYDDAMDKIEAGSVIGDDLNYYDVSQGDNLKYCQCKNCMKVYSQEGGAWSGAVVRWANLVEEEMDDLGLDGLKFHIFAYHGTNIPCITRPNEDVVVCLCLDGSCYRHALDGSQCIGASFDMAGEWGKDVRLNNVDYAEWIRGWCELTDDLRIWYYALGVKYHQFSMIFPLYEDVKFMKEAGVNYLYWSSSGFSGLGPTPIESELNIAYQMNPDMTPQEYREAVAHIFEKLYGDGWQYVLELSDIWEEAEMLCDHCDNCWCFGMTDPDMLNWDFFFSQFDRINELANAAMHEVNSNWQEAKLKRFLAHYLYNLCYAGYFQAYEADNAEDLAKISECYLTAIKYMNDIGINHHALLDNEKNEIFDTVEETAWRVWADDREKILGNPEEMRPAPEEYAG